MLDDHSVPERNSPSFGYYFWHIQNEGREMSLQDRDRAIVLAYPSGLKELSYAGTLQSLSSVSKMRHSWYISELDDRVDEIWLDESKVESLPAQDSAVKPIFLRDGSFYLALVPLPGNTVQDGSSKIRIERREVCEQDKYPTNPKSAYFGKAQFLEISLLHYDGAQKPMTRDDWEAVQSGALVWVSDSSRSGTFEEFRQEVRRTQILDVRQGSVRKVEARFSDGISLAGQFDRRSEEWLGRWIDGNPVSFPAHRTSRSICGRGMVEVNGVTAAADFADARLILLVSQGGQIVRVGNGKNREIEVTLRGPVGSRTVRLPAYEFQTVRLDSQE